jgi:hypothetical protein
MDVTNFSYFTYSYLNTELSEIHSVLLEFGKNNKYKIEIKDFEFDLFTDRPPFGGAHFPKAIFYKPKCCEDKTIMISNYSDGWESLSNYISNELKTSCCSFKISINENIDDVLNSFSFWKEKSIQRHVSVMKDPKKWIFYEYGDPLWFENTSHYKQKVIKKRLTKDILIFYSNKLGIDVLNSHFLYSNKDSLYIENIKW